MIIKQNDYVLITESYESIITLSNLRMIEIQVEIFEYSENT